METQTKQEQIKSELNQNTGTTQYFKIPFSDFIYTDGINDLINKCKCHWLISDLGIELSHKKIIKEFLLVNIKVNDDKSCLITIKEDTNEPIIFKKEYKYTDFPLKEFEFYICDKIILLKSEY